MYNKILWIGTISKVIPAVESLIGDVKKSAFNFTEWPSCPQVSCCMAFVGAVGELVIITLIARKGRLLGGNKRLQPFQEKGSSTRTLSKTILS